MKKALYEQLDRVNQCFEYSKGACDPLEYVKRKCDLLHMVTLTILMPFYEERARKFKADMKKGRK